MYVDDRAGHGAESAAGPPSPDAGHVWRRLRTPLFVVFTVAMAAVVLVLTRSGGGPPLDPASAEPDGSRALARLLRGQGVSVHTAYTSGDLPSAPRPGTTLLITRPALVAPEALRSLATTADSVVLVAPDTAAVRAVAPAIDIEGELATQVRPPGCTMPAALAAGPATLGGTSYSGERTCYDGALANTVGVTVLGSPAPFTNDALDEEGNAALALRLLGKHERLVWYVPSAGDPALRGDEESLIDLLPPGWVFGAVQVGVAAVLFALWRARRLGPVVTEPLPAAVRGAETVEGRARLYRRAGAAGHAAAALRAATLHRLTRALGLPSDPPRQVVLDAVSHRTGQDAAALLYGPAPTGDAELVRLADALDALERDVLGRAVDGTSARGKEVDS